RSSRWGAKPQVRRSSPWRKKSWNCKTGDGADSPTPGDGAGAGSIVSPPSRNDPDFPGTPVANCGTTRYSTVEGVPLAEKTVHPESDEASIDTYAARVMASPPCEIKASHPYCASSPPAQRAPQRNPWIRRPTSSKAHGHMVASASRSKPLPASAKNTT